jgi:hypothetical protein
MLSIYCEHIHSYVIAESSTTWRSVVANEVMQSLTIRNGHVTFGHWP